MTSKPHERCPSCQRFNSSQHLQSDSKHLIWFVCLPACESKGKSEWQHCFGRDVGRVRKKHYESSPLKATPLGFYPLRRMYCLGTPAHHGCERRGLRLPLGRSPSLPGVYRVPALSFSVCASVCVLSQEFTVCIENIHENGLHYAADTGT